MLASDTTTVSLLREEWWSEGGDWWLRSIYGTVWSIVASGGGWSWVTCSMLFWAEVSSWGWTRWFSLITWLMVSYSATTWSSYADWALDWDWTRLDWGSRLSSDWPGLVSTSGCEISEVVALNGIDRRGVKSNGLKFESSKL